MRIFNRALGMGLLAVTVSIHCIATQSLWAQDKQALKADNGAIMLPADVIDDQVVSLVWLDIASIAPQQVKAVFDTYQDMLRPMFNHGDMDEMHRAFDIGLAKYEDFHEKFIAAGGRGALIGMTPPGMRDQSFMPSMFLMVHVEPGTSIERIVEAMRELTHEDEANPLLVEDFHRHDERWLIVDPENNEVDSQMFYQPQAGDSAATQWYQHLLDTNTAMPIRMAHRMNDSLRDLMFSVDTQDMPAPMLAFLPMVKQIDGLMIGMNIEQGVRSQMRLRMSDAMSAEDMKRLLDGFIVLGKQMYIGYTTQKAQQNGEAITQEFQQQIRKQAGKLDAMYPTVDALDLVFNLQQEFAQFVMTEISIPIAEARASALHTASMANLRNLAMVMQIYAADYYGTTPESLHALIGHQRQYLLSYDVFIHPRHADHKSIPEHLSGEELADWIEANSDYKIVLWDTNLHAIRRPALTVMAHEIITPTMKQVAIAFADGHVETFDIEQGQNIIEAGVKP